MSVDAIGESGSSNEGDACGAELDYLANATWIAFKQARLRLDRSENVHQRRFRRVQHSALASSRSQR